MQRNDWAKKTKIPTVQLVDDVPAYDTKNTAQYLMVSSSMLYASLLQEWQYKCRG